MSLGEPSCGSIVSFGVGERCEGDAGFCTGGCIGVCAGFIWGIVLGGKCGSEGT